MGVGSCAQACAYSGSAQRGAKCTLVACIALGAGAFHSAHKVVGVVAQKQQHAR